MIPAIPRNFSVSENFHLYIVFCLESLNLCTQLVYIKFFIQILYTTNVIGILFLAMRASLEKPFFFKSFMTTCTYMFLLSRFSGKLCVGKMNCIYLKILHKTLYLSFFVVLLLCKLFSMIFRSFSTEFIFYITCS